MKKFFYKSYHLSQISSWNSLPWKQIDTRIILIQRKIFEAAREYNQYKVHKIQNYLLNCNESKLIAINNIINSIHNYYNFNNSDKYYCTNEDKFIIFKNIFSESFNNEYLNNRINLIIEKVKEYIIYLCIEPEWKARYEPFLRKNLNCIKNNYISINLYKNIYKQNFALFNIINRLKSLPYINNTIYYWLYNKYHLYKPNTSLLFIVLKKISLIGLEWSQIKNFKLNNSINYKESFNFKEKLFYTISNLHCINEDVYFLNILYIDKYLLSQILFNIRKKLYKKDYINRLRFNHSLNSINIIKIFIEELQKIYIFYIHLIFKTQFKKIIQLINQLLSINKQYLYKQNNLKKLNHTEYQLYQFIYKKTVSSFLNKYLIKINR